MRLSKPSIVMWRLILGVYLLLFVLLVYVSVPALSFVPFGLSLRSPTIAVEILLLLFGLTIVALARLEPKRIWTVLLSLGFVSTIVSGIHVVANSLSPNVCGILFHNYGFPFPWYSVTSFYQPVGLFCPLPAFVTPTRVDSISFIFDMISYVGSYFAALEMIRAIGSLTRKASTRNHVPSMGAEQDRSTQLGSG